METEHKVRPIGSTFRYDGRKYHIIGHCYDEKEDGRKMLIYIVKFFGKYKQWWHYEVMTSEEYDWYIKAGVLYESRVRQDILTTDREDPGNILPKSRPKSRSKSILTRGQLQTLIVKGGYEILAASTGECASDGITIKIDERDVEIDKKIDKKL